MTRILAISGSLRTQSTNTAALRTLAGLAAESHPTVDVSLYGGLAGLPAFDPDDDTPARLPAAVTELRQAIADADALLFSTPEYAGGLPGSFKNLLDWMIGDPGPRSIYEKPVAWLNVSARGAALAHESLRTVLGYAKAEILEDVCAAVPVGSSMVDGDGLVSDGEVRAALARIVNSLADRDRGAGNLTRR